MSADEQRPIGIFDSGIGGLTVLREVIRCLPGEDTIYLGDTARVPYGNKSSETVIRYAVETTDFLLDRKIKMLVVACNTASAVSLPTLKARYKIPIVGVIQPGAKKAAEITKTGRVGVIGTERTIKSGAYPQAIKEIDPKIRVFSQPCPLFVPLVEEGLAASDIAEMAAKRYLHPIRERKLDALVLGCTHYPLLKRVIRRAVGERISLVDSAVEIAREAFRILAETDLLRKTSSGGKHGFYVTDYPERFIKVGAKFLRENLSVVKQIRL
jgi:glutamate racemase